MPLKAPLALSRFGDTGIFFVSLCNVQWPLQPLTHPNFKIVLGCRLRPFNAGRTVAYLILKRGYRSIRNYVYERASAPGRRSPLTPRPQASDSNGLHTNETAAEDGFENRACNNAIGITISLRLTRPTILNRQSDAAIRLKAITMLPRCA